MQDPNQNPQMQSQTPTAGASVETQLALINHVMNQTGDQVKEVRAILNKIVETSIKKSEFDTLTSRVAVLERDLDAANTKFELHMQDYLVTKAENGLVKKLVYGATGIILTMVVGALVALVVIARTQT